MKTTTLIISIVLPLLFVTQTHSQTVVQNLSVSQSSFRPLAATEQEMRQFFENYIERYTRKDVDGFLGLFSSKAIQNQKNGLPEIRKIYSDFFNQSRELHYLLEDPKIEIYQNAVEVKARYVIDQIPKEGKQKRIWTGSVRWVLGKENGALKILSLDYQHQ